VITSAEKIHYIKLLARGDRRHSQNNPSSLTVADLSTAARAAAFSAFGAKNQVEFSLLQKGHRVSVCESVGGIPIRADSKGCDRLLTNHGCEQKSQDK